LLDIFKNEISYLKKIYIIKEALFKTQIDEFDVFALIDVNNNEYIDIMLLTAFFNKLSVQVTRTQVQALIRKFGAVDGKITMSQFQELIFKNKPNNKREYVYRPKSVSRVSLSPTKDLFPIREINDNFIFNYKSESKTDDHKLIPWNSIPRPLTPITIKSEMSKQEHGPIPKITCYSQARFRASFFDENTTSEINYRTNAEPGSREKSGSRSRETSLKENRINSYEFQL
jgi:hypothetical protein